VVYFFYHHGGGPAVDVVEDVAGEAFVGVAAVAVAGAGFVVAWVLAVIVTFDHFDAGVFCRPFPGYAS
jgi:hypothetical protein